MAHRATLPMELRDAGDYITSLPKAEQALAEWQTATGCLIRAAEGRDFRMHAPAGMSGVPAIRESWIRYLHFRCGNEPKRTSGRF